MRDAASPPAGAAEPDGLALVVTAEPTAEERTAVHLQLREYNRLHTQPANAAPLAVLLRDEDGSLVAGLIGETAWEWLYVEFLWVSEPLRGRGWGRRLLRAAEAEARVRGCHSAYLDTFEFQARPFYEREGYTVFGTLEGFPPGSRRFFLQKRLAGA